ncbi:MAG: methyltransferase [Chitinophagaceae bacterium]|nr:MAG: methyltransferase [Chitinophagaceae bacterium]
MISTSILNSFNFLADKISAKRKIFLTTSLNYIDRKHDFACSGFDYVRYATLELLSYEISEKKIGGSLAELGVYKGEFAKWINKCFPDKKLFLFDTFDGFDERDVANEINNDFSKASSKKEFSNTSVNEVMAKMFYPENVIVKQGFFPETARDVNDTFCLVSLDADLYDPIYNGLSFFYPKLSHGGYILIHDYNNDTYKGSKNAVIDFCKKYEINFIPIPDTAGTAIITRP